jgi:hypothetical protein
MSKSIPYAVGQGQRSEAYKLLPLRWDAPIKHAARAKEKCGVASTPHKGFIDFASQAAATLPLLVSAVI